MPEILALADSTELVVACCPNSYVCVTVVVLSLYLINKTALDLVLMCTLPQRASFRLIYL